jgi:hypothetical protein
MSLGGAPLEQTVPRRYRNVRGVRGATSTSPMCQGGLYMLRLFVAATVPYQARSSARPKCSLSRQSGLWFCKTQFLFPTIFLSLGKDRLRQIVWKRFANAHDAAGLAAIDWHVWAIVQILLSQMRVCIYTLL